MNRRKGIALLAGAASALVISALNGCFRPRVRAFTNLSVNYNLKLPSGEMVAITDAHGDSFEDVNHVKRHIYYIAYDSNHFDDPPALRQEALHVWAAYLPQIIGVDYDSAVVTPEKKDEGGGMEGRPLYLKRAPDGTWQVTCC